MVIQLEGIVVLLQMVIQLQGIVVLLQLITTARYCCAFTNGYNCKVLLWFYKWIQLQGIVVLLQMQLQGIVVLLATDYVP